MGDELFGYLFEGWQESKSKSVILSEAKRRGARYASVTTGLDKGHAPARRAYERVGFSSDVSLETADLYMIL